MGFHFQSCRWRSAHAWAFALMWSLLLAPRIAGAEESPAGDRAKRGLSEVLRLQYVEVPLSDAVADLREKLGVELLIDKRALDDIGVGRNTPITFVAHDITARSCLKLMLRDLELVHVMRDGAVWITTHEASESSMSTKVYPVRDLLVPVEDHTSERLDYRSLIDAVITVIDPDSWSDFGGPGTIEAAQGSLVVLQTDQIHEQLADLLATYRKLIEHDMDSLPEQVFLGAPGDALVRTRLQGHVSGDYVELPLGDALSDLANKTDCNIKLDVRALQDSGIDTSVPVSAEFVDTSLASALRRLLHDHDLTFVVRDETLLITTQDQAQAELIVALYPVADLLASDANAEHDEAQQAYACGGSHSAPEPDTLQATECAITSTVDAESWQMIGGPASIAMLRKLPAFAIAQTEANHERIAKLLRDLRAARESQDAEVSDAKRIRLQRYPLFDPTGSVSSMQVVDLLYRELKEADWHGEGVYIEAMGQSIVVKHNQSVHRRVRALLSELRLWQEGAAFSGGGFF